MLGKQKRNNKNPLICIQKSVKKAGYTLARIIIISGLIVNLLKIPRNHF